MDNDHDISSDELDLKKEPLDLVDEADIDPIDAIVAEEDSDDEEDPYAMSMRDLMDPNGEKEMEGYPEYQF